MDRRYTIYKMTTPSGYNYIGKTCRYESRKVGHRSNPVSKVVEHEQKRFGYYCLDFEVLAEDKCSLVAFFIEFKHICKNKNGKNLNSVYPDINRFTNRKIGGYDLSGLIEKYNQKRETAELKSNQLNYD